MSSGWSKEMEPHHIINSVELRLVLENHKEHVPNTELEQQSKFYIPLKVYFLIGNWYGQES